MRPSSFPVWHKCKKTRARSLFCCRLRCFDPEPTIQQTRLQRNRLNLHHSGLTRPDPEPVRISLLRNHPFELLDRTGALAIVHRIGPPPIYALPKVEISFFKGENPCGWVRHSEKYFMVHHTPNKQKTTIASLYLGEIVDVWYRGWLMKFDTLY